MTWPMQMTVYVRELHCYVCAEKFQIGSEKLIAEPLKTPPVCGKCAEFLPKFPKFGYERPSPPKEFIPLEAA